MQFLTVPVDIFASMFFGGWASLIFSLGFVIALILLTAEENFVVGYILTVIYLILMAIFSNSNPFVWIWHHPSELLGFGLMYIIIGGAYSIIKYRSFVSKSLLEIQQLKRKFITDLSIAINVTQEIPDDMKGYWKEYVQRNSQYPSLYSSIRRGFRPSDNATLIINWITFWPFSLIGMFFADFLSSIFRWAYNILSEVYTSVYNRLVSSYINSKDLEI